jgi:hypothetical protein
LVLNVVQKSNDPAIIIAHYSGRHKCWNDGAVPPLQKAVDDVSLRRAVAQTFEDIVGGTLAGREHHGNIPANEFVDAETCHCAKGSVDNVDAERRDVDDELTDRAALEYRRVQKLAFLKSRRVGS